MSLTRRRFVLGGLGLGAAGLAGYAGIERPWRALAAGEPRARRGDGILVLVTLYGGNDGLNTVIPYQDDRYRAARGDLAWSADQVLPLRDGLALHPSLKGLKRLWDDGRVAIVRGVGYPDPNRSHFRSMDIWQSGEPESAVTTGWLGRWLDRTGRDPLRAVAVGAQLPRALTGEKASGSAVPIGPLTLPGGAATEAAFAALERPYDGEPALAARVAQTGTDLLTVAHEVARALAAPVTAGNAPAGASLEPSTASSPGGQLVRQLDVVARLIVADEPTRVYAVSLGGFDTHIAEKDAHARLMGELDTALSDFVSRIASSPAADRVVVVAYSEFGRRVAANAGGGTDHGTAAPVFVVGPAVRGGFYGDEPGLTDLDDGDLRFTTDFRSIYATLLERVLGVDATVSSSRPFPSLAFL